MPIVNTLAFLFTVVGEWWVEKKVISRSTPSPSPSRPHSWWPSGLAELTS